jgi:hypothetical protein
MPYRHAALAACCDCRLAFAPDELEVGDDGWRCWRCGVAREVHGHEANAPRASLTGRGPLRAFGSFLAGALVTLPAYVVMLVLSMMLAGAASPRVSALAALPLPLTVVGLWICAARSWKRSRAFAFGLFASPWLLALAVLLIVMFMLGRISM